MKMRAPLLILTLALISGIVYSVLTSPESAYIYGIHIYMFLAIISASSAFLARFSVNASNEKVILLTTAGLIAVIVSPTLFNAALSESIMEEVFTQAFITLFFAGHAALVGTFFASLLKKIIVSNKFRKIPQRPQRKTYYRYPVTE